LNQNKNTNIIAYKNAGNGPYYRNFGAPKNGALGLSLFSLMVNPGLGEVLSTGISSTLFIRKNVALLKINYSTNHMHSLLQHLNS